MRLSIMFARELQPDVRDMASSSLRLIKTANVFLPVKGVDIAMQPMTGARYNVLSDQGA